MLVLSREINERILIGTDIVLTVVRIGDTTVRIGIDAPDSYKIVREELIEPGVIEDAIAHCHGRPAGAAPGPLPAAVKSPWDTATRGVLRIGEVR